MNSNKSSARLPRPYTLPKSPGSRSTIRHHRTSAIGLFGLTGAAAQTSPEAFKSNPSSVVQRLAARRLGLRSGSKKPRVSVPRKGKGTEAFLGMKLQVRRFLDPPLPAPLDTPTSSSIFRSFVLFYFSNLQVNFRRFLICERTFVRGLHRSGRLPDR